MLDECKNDPNDEKLYNCFGFRFDEISKATQAPHTTKAKPGFKYIACLSLVFTLILIGLKSLLIKTEN